MYTNHYSTYYSPISSDRTPPRTPPRPHRHRTAHRTAHRATYRRTGSHTRTLQPHHCPHCLTPTPTSPPPTITSTPSPITSSLSLLMLCLLLLLFLFLPLALPTIALAGLLLLATAAVLALLLLLRLPKAVLAVLVVAIALRSELSLPDILIPHHRSSPSNQPVTPNPQWPGFMDHQPRTHVSPSPSTFSSAPSPLATSSPFHAPVPDEPVATTPASPMTTPKVTKGPYYSLDRHVALVLHRLRTLHTPDDMHASSRSSPSQPDVGENHVKRSLAMRTSASLVHNTGVVVHYVSRKWHAALLTTVRIVAKTAVRMEARGWMCSALEHVNESDGWMMRMQYTILRRAGDWCARDGSWLRW